MLRKLYIKHLFFAFLPWSLFWSNLKIDTSLDSKKLKIIFIEPQSDTKVSTCANPKALANNEFIVTLSESSKARQKGLSQRTRPLKKNEAMLFLFSRKNEPQTSCPGFWMKDTYIPLDLGFISQEGVLFDIHTMDVEDHPNHPTRSYTTNKSCVAALETAPKILTSLHTSSKKQLCVDWY